MSPIERARCVKEIGRTLGFDAVGVAPAGPLPRRAFLDEWLSRGYAGTMTYLHRNREIRKNPAAILDRTRSIIVVAKNYHTPGTDAAPAVRIARYAWGRDYHTVLRTELQRFVERLHDALDVSFDSRICVDTAPINEREIAATAGVGWIGKNTMLLQRGLGSYLFLGEIVTTLELAADAPATDHCGSCTRCLDACPTNAFPEPYILNASRCISYLTIEHRAEIPTEFHTPIGDWLYGCDICQEVCPFNATAPDTRDAAFAVSPPTWAPEEIRQWDQDDYKRATTDSAMRRARLDILHRNAAIVAANQQQKLDAGA